MDFRHIPDLPEKWPLMWCVSCFAWLCSKRFFFHFCRSMRNLVQKPLVTRICLCTIVKCSTPARWLHCAAYICGVIMSLGSRMKAQGLLFSFVIY